MSADAAKNVVRAVRELFAGTHWTQGRMHTYQDGKDYYCLIGGLRQCAIGGPHGHPDTPGDDNGYAEALKALARAVLEDPERSIRFAEEGGDGWFNYEALENELIDFNDNDATHVSDVLLALDEAERKLLQVEQAT